MTQIIKWILLVALLLPSIAQADIAIIVHNSNTTNSISKAELKNIYRVRVSHFINRTPIIISYQPAEKEISQHFFSHVVEKSLTQLNRFWATKIFSGRMERPLQFTEDALVIKWVSQNINGIGYIDVSNLTNAVKKIATIQFTAENQSKTEPPIPL